MSQSEQRVPGRGRTPPSFGREPDGQPEDFTIRGGESFHLVLHVAVEPDQASLEKLRVAIRETTRAGVLDGYAAAFAEMDEPPPAGGPGPEGG